MLHTRGFTILEVSIALAILVTALAATWSVVFQANRHQRALWEEWTAHELAVSALEDAGGTGVVAFTPPDGRPFEFRELACEPLSGLRMVLHVRPTPERRDLCDLQVVVSWQPQGGGTERKLERTARRRLPR